MANCFETGPLKGRKMDLVGHCDPRGADDYNMALGGRRADNVQKIIVSLGLSSSNVSTSSRGKMDATGTDEASWAKDRKVDVNVARSAAARSDFSDASVRSGGFKSNNASH